MRFCGKHPCTARLDGSNFCLVCPNTFGEFRADRVAKVLAEHQTLAHAVPQGSMTIPGGQFITI